MVKIVAVLLCLVPITVLADNRIELSYTQKTGNQVAKSGYGLVDYSSKKNSHEYKLYTKGNYIENDGQDYLVELSGKKHFKPYFTMLLAGWDKNVSAGYFYIVFGGPGAGVSLLDDKLLASVIFLYGENKYIDNSRTVSKSVRLDGSYERELPFNFLFKQTVKYTRHLSKPTMNFFVSKSQIETGGKLALGISYEYERQSSPVEGKLKTDGTLNFLLIYRM